MKLSTIIPHLHPIAFYAGLTPITGGTTATLFLCQFIYWTGRQADPDGWVYKTREEIRGETGLGRFEQETARKQLRARGLIQEKLRGNPATLHYRVDMDALEAAWGAYSFIKLEEVQPASWRESSQQDGGKAPTKMAGIQPTIITETTAETTSSAGVPAGNGSLFPGEWETFYRLLPKGDRMIAQRIKERSEELGEGALIDYAVSQTLISGPKGRGMLAYFVRVFESVRAGGIPKRTGNARLRQEPQEDTWQPFKMKEYGPRG